MTYRGYTMGIENMQHLRFIFTFHGQPTTYLKDLDDLQEMSMGKMSN